MAFYKCEVLAFMVQRSIIRTALFPQNCEGVYAIIETVLLSASHNAALLGNVVLTKTLPLKCHLGVALFGYLNSHSGKR